MILLAGVQSGEGHGISIDRRCREAALGSSRLWVLALSVLSLRPTSGRVRDIHSKTKGTARPFADCHSLIVGTFLSASHFRPLLLLLKMGSVYTEGAKGESRQSTNTVCDIYTP